MNTNNTLRKQLEEEKNCLNFIKNWFKGTWGTNIIAWIINFILKTTLQIEYLTLFCIIFTIATSLTSIYMINHYSQTKHNIKKLSHKLYIEETNILLDSKKSLTKNHSKNNNQYTYTPNNCYKETTYLTPENRKNYKPKKRVLTKSKKFKEK